MAMMKRVAWSKSLARRYGRRGVVWWVFDEKDRGVSVVVGACGVRKAIWLNPREDGWRGCE